MEETNARYVLSDQLITLSGFYSQQKYPEKIRKVIYWDDEQKREFTFLTNATEISALEVANLYKNRWQVELFFYDKYIIMQSKLTLYDKNLLIE